MRIEKIFARLGCTDGDKVSLATYVFEGQAEHWWRMIQRQYEGHEANLNWAEFLRLFDEKYYPVVVQKQKQVEFLTLEQKGMTVAEYEAKFAELSRFAPQHITTEADKVTLFESGLRPAIRSRVAILEPKTLAELITKALLAEKSMDEAQRSREGQSKRQGDTSRTGQNHGGKRANNHQSSGENSGQQARRVCNQCRKTHSSGYFCDGTAKNCFKCGKPGHIATFCRSNGGQQLQRSLINGPTQGKSGEQRQNLGRPENMTHGRVFALTQEEADASPSAVQGFDEEQ
ncbi:hypothetical protein U1Q18_052446 [Sarracenia purpurea var. burkii]